MMQKKQGRTMQLITLAELHSWLKPPTPPSSSAADSATEIRAKLSEMLCAAVKHQKEQWSSSAASEVRFLRLLW